MSMGLPTPTTILVDALEFAVFIGEEAPLIVELFNAKKAGVASEALVAAIRATTLEGSDQAMRDELTMRDELKSPTGG